MGVDDEAVIESGAGRRLWTGVAVLAAVIVVVAVVTASGGTEHPPGAGEAGAARDFELPNVRKGDPTVTLSALRGKPVVLNFWASWCIPCRKEMPGFQDVAEQRRGEVSFVGVNHRDSRRLAAEFLAETGVRYPSGYDPEGKVAAAYRLLGMPTTVFISADGRIVGRRTGEMSRDDLDETMRRLFDL